MERQQDGESVMRVACIYNSCTLCIAFVFIQQLYCSELFKWLNGPKFYSGGILILVGPASFV